jgi:hypothetical protein
MPVSQKKGSVQFSILGDRETEVPFGSLCKYWANPKTDLRKQDTEGIEASIETFGVRDRLKVWPHPRIKNQYVVLNGNKRIDILRSMIEADLGLKDARNAQEAETIHAKILAQLIPVQIMNMTEEQAEIFVGTWDRHRATHKEIDIIELFKKHQNSSVKDKIQKLLSPKLSAIEPPDKEGPPTAGGADADARQGGEAGDNVVDVDPDAENPWGDAPADTSTHDLPPAQLPSAAGAQEALGFGGDDSNLFIPIMFSISKEINKVLQKTILKCKARVWQQQKLLQALELLSRKLDGEPLKSEDMIVEIALRVLYLHTQNIKTYKHASKKEAEEFEGLDDMVDAAGDDGEDEEI